MRGGDLEFLRSLLSKHGSDSLDAFNDCVDRNTGELKAKVVSVTTDGFITSLGCLNKIFRVIDQLNGNNNITKYRDVKVEKERYKPGNLFIRYGFNKVVEEKIERDKGIFKSEGYLFSNVMFNLYSEGREALSGNCDVYEEKHSRLKGLIV